MKYLIITILITANLFAQLNKTNLVQKKIANDAISYNQFLDLGKCQCLDNLMEKSKIQKLQISDKNNNLFSRQFYTLYDLGYSLPTFYNLENLRKTLIKFQDENIESIIKKYREKDENIRLDYSSPFLFCNKLFEHNYKTMKTYKVFIYNRKYFLQNDSNENKYLNGGFNFQ